MGVESHYQSKKDRVFVRAIAGKYNLQMELERLRALPRVVKGAEIKFQDGPQSYSKHFVEPVDGMTQTLHVHLEEYAPGGRTQKHGHVKKPLFISWKELVMKCTMAYATTGRRAISPLSTIIASTSILKRIKISRRARWF